MRRRRSLPIAASACVGAALALSPATASAYRPFDGTDADTADLGDFELELGPAHYDRQGAQNFLVAPALVLNFGIFERTELVIDANSFVAVGPLSPGVSRVSLHGDDVLVKHTFREGTLQGKTGLSVAAEGGVLTPEVNGVADVGASLNVITSYRFPAVTLHWNEWFELTREHRGDLFSGLIVEGPHDWRVRPVAELFYDKDFAGVSTESALVGAIAQARETLAFDLAVRGAREGDANALEVRAGLTWTLSMWEPSRSATGD